MKEVHVHGKSNSWRVASTEHLQTRCTRLHSSCAYASLCGPIDRDVGYISIRVVQYHNHRSRYRGEALWWLGPG